MDHEVTGPDGHQDHLRGDRGHRPAPRSSPGCKPGRDAADRQVPGLRLVVAALACPRCTTRSGPRWPPPATPAGTGCSPSSASTSTTSGPPPTSRSTATPSCSRPSGWPSSTCCRPAPAPSAARIGAKGLTGEGYDGHTFWDTETFCLPVLSYVAPEAAADALRWRQSILPLAYERAEQLGAQGRGVPVAHHPRPGVLRLLAGRHRRVPHQRRHRRRRAPARARPPATTSSSARSGWSCWWRPRGCGARSATTTVQGEFRIDGVTGPDEYTAIVDNNVYTNLMAQQNLRVAADTAARHARAGGPARRERRGDGQLARRGQGDAHPVRRACSACTRSREGFTDHQLWDFEGTAGREVPAAAERSRTSTCTASR